ncbi:MULTISPECIES: hypothetical protein [Rhodococcus]|uniref:Uncharacterized protein n=1 Tax=Rhodococcus qingshengii JCM 15477 TaxID=1303681 RepID=A0AB38RQ38_RHOSG|nr:MULTISPECIES: hypothetical protein [Rhodococcus]UPU46889.1 hypothetical protein M0639_32150 [Rhodococcus qingshengii JCM 15477]
MYLAATGTHPVYGAIFAVSRTAASGSPPPKRSPSQAAGRPTSKAAGSGGSTTAIRPSPLDRAGVPIAMTFCAHPTAPRASPRVATGALPGQRRIIYAATTARTIVTSNNSSIVSSVCVCVQPAMLVSVVRPRALRAGSPLRSSAPGLEPVSRGESWCAVRTSCQCRRSSGTSPVQISGPLPAGKRSSSGSRLPSSVSWG